MTNFYGADVEQLKQLANELQSAAGDLNGIAARAGSRLGQTQWRGPDSDSFRNAWESRHLVAIKQAAQRLSEASALASRNAIEQTDTSSGETSSVVGGPGNLLEGITGADLALPYQPLPGVLPFSGGEGDWSPLDFIRYGSTLPNNLIPGTPWSFDQIGQFVPGIGEALNVTNYVEAISAGKFPIHEIIGDAGGMLRSSPSTYLGGAAVGIWDQVFQQGEKADFSPQQITDNWNFIQSNGADALAGARDALIAWAPDFIAAFKPGFK